MPTQTSPQSRPLLALLIVAILMGIVVACGSSDSPSASGDLAANSDAETGSSLTADRLISNPSGNYSMDELVTVGFKKSKQFETDTLPRAIDVWYGFFNQKDIEVRVYENHRDALDFGVEPAEAAIAKDPGQTDYLIPVVNRYPAYVVYGNLVMLCERELATCEALTGELN
jgi:hypothetical protein